MKRLRAIVRLMASGLTEAESIRVVDAADCIAELVGHGLSPHMGIWLVEALATATVEP